VRNGSVIDLQIGSGTIKALVSGSEIYEIEVKITAVNKGRWKSICKDCAGAIDSLVELLQGRFSAGVMERICREKTGLFPSPNEIHLSCSCPDWASMCKHVAAVLYGIGARLDKQPELLFRLHDLDEGELIAKAGAALPLAKKGAASANILRSDDLSGLFGLDMARGGVPNAKVPATKGGKRKPAKRRRGKTPAKPSRRV
jgi:uncharacterized Zn finger protein